MERRWPCCWLMAAGIFGITIAGLGREAAFAIWNIRVVHPSFPDSRSITSGCELHAMGGDPLVANPRDPMGRPFNYPRLWLELSRLGVNQSHTDMIGYMLICSFLFGMWMFPPADVNWAGICMLLATAFSPAALLAMERGNNDLLVFLLVAIAVGLFASGWKRGREMGVTALLAGVVLKIYPAFGLAICLGEPRQRFIRWLGFCTAVVLIYVFAIREDLLLINQGTPKSSGLSYGMNVFWMKIAEHAETPGRVARALSWAGIAIAAGLLAAGRLWASEAIRKIATENKSMAAFRAGAAIYCGTFLLGNNWDYRLIFLIFTLPFLSSLIHCNLAWLRAIALSLCTCILISMWFIAIHLACRDYPLGSEASVLLDECANWLVFLGLGFLFGASLPCWKSAAPSNATAPH